MKNFLFAILTIALLSVACSSDNDSGDSNDTTDSFDRKALLENVADNIVIPSYQGFLVDMKALKTATSKFVATADEPNLVSLREAWSTAYTSWQNVNMFEIGKAEEISFRNFMNVYPVNTDNITTNVTSGTYDLATISQQDEQGFGALDYLINGVSSSDGDIVATYTDVTNGAKYKTYITDVVNRMEDLTTQVVNDWASGYRDSFVNNSGSSATSSLDKLVNDYIFHYEKHLRAGKIGIPAGVFSGSPLNDKVEAFYDKDLSKTLFNANLDAMQDFFNGKKFGASSTGASLKTYLDFLNTIKDGEDLSKLINNQFDKSRSTAVNLSNDLSTQVKSDNSLMLTTYDELQKNVVFLKVDMLQAISVSVDYVDADGD